MKKIKYVPLCRILFLHSELIKILASALHEITKRFFNQFEAEFVFQEDKSSIYI